MTRLAVVSDVHGNLPALEAGVADVRAQGAEQVVVAGDLANYGPFSNELFAWADAERWPVIRGNGELYLTDLGTPRGDPGWTRPGPPTLAAWFHARVEDRWRRAVAAWPDTLCLRFPDGPPLRVVHGSPRSPYEGMHGRYSDAELLERLANPAERTIVFGHTHEVVDRHVQGLHLVNPGSAGNSCDGDARAQYALIEATDDGWRATPRRVAYDVGATIDAYRAQGFVETVGATALMVIRELETARSHLGPYLRWRRAEHPDQPSSLALAEQFTEAKMAQYSEPHRYVPPR
jgi:predicted phosphodiesterase